MDEFVLEPTRNEHPEPGHELERLLGPARTERHEYGRHGHFVLLATVIEITQQVLARAHRIHRLRDEEGTSPASFSKHTLVFPSTSLVTLGDHYASQRQGGDFVLAKTVRVPQAEIHGLLPGRSTNQHRGSAASLQTPQPFLQSRSIH